MEAISYGHVVYAIWYCSYQGIERAKLRLIERYTDILTSNNAYYVDLDTSIERRGTENFIRLAVFDIIKTFEK